MNMVLMALYDNKGKVMKFHHFYQHEAEAIRSFIDSAKSPESTIKKFPEDFDLYKLCEITDDGTLVNIEKKCLMTGINAVAVGG